MQTICERQLAVYPVGVVDMVSGGRTATDSLMVAPERVWLILAYHLFTFCKQQLVNRIDNEREAAQATVATIRKHDTDHLVYHSSGSQPVLAVRKPTLGVRTILILHPQLGV